MNYFLTRVFILALISISMTLAFPVGAQAGQGLRQAAQAANVSTASTPPQTIIGNVVGGLLSTVGIVFFGLVIYGGVMMMISRGNEEYATKGRQLVTTASIGLVMVIGSFAITQFVFQSIGSQSADTQVTDGSGNAVPDPTVGGCCRMTDTVSQEFVIIYSTNAQSCQPGPGVDAVFTPNQAAEAAEQRNGSGDTVCQAN